MSNFGRKKLKTKFLKNRRKKNCIFAYVNPGVSMSYFKNVSKFGSAVDRLAAIANMSKELYYVDEPEIRKKFLLLKSKKSSI